MSKHASYASNEGSVDFVFPLKTAIDLNLLNTLATGAHSRFLTCSYRENDSRRVISLDTNGSYSLKDYLDNKFDNFAALLLECFEAILECGSLKIPLGNILVEPNLIFVKNGHLKLSVLPVADLPRVDAKKLYLQIIRLFVLPPQIKKKLIGSVKAARDGNDALHRAVRELADHINGRKRQPWMNQSDPPQPEKDEPAAPDQAGAAETAYIDSDAEHETVPLDGDDSGETVPLDGGLLSKGVAVFGGNRTDN